MKKILQILSFLTVLLGLQPALAQLQTSEGGGRILDDSTQNVYGPTTTEYIHEIDWFENRITQRPMDTSVTNFHRYNWVARNDYLLLNLGQLGTQLQSIYPLLPDRIGPRWGLDAFDWYRFRPGEIKYYDTKSPHSDWYYIQGGGRKFVVDITQAQNINPHWSIMARYGAVTVPLLLGTRPISRNLRHARHENILLNTRFETPNKRYRLLAHYTSSTHRTAEPGGLDLSESVLTAQNDTIVFNDLFRPEYRGRLLNRLNEVESYTRKYNLRVYQQFSLDDSATSALQIFNVFNREWHKFTYEDLSVGTVSNEQRTNANFYQAINPDSTIALPRSIAQQMLFQELDNQIGIKGTRGNLFFAGFARLKQFKFQQSFPIGTDIPVKVNSFLSLGGQLNYTLPDTSLIRITAEAIPGSDHHFKATYQGKLGFLSLEQMSFRPDEPTQFLIGDIFFFENDFVNTTAQRLLAKPAIKVWKATLAPFVEFNNFNNFVYYDSVAVARQYGSSFTYLRAGLDAHLHTGYFHHVTKLIYTQNSAEQVLRMPEFFANYQFFFQKEVFNGALFLQTGVDFQWTSAFYANAFMPLTQRFHLQNYQEVGDFVYSEFFVNLRINRVRLMGKVSNLLKNVLGTSVFATPGYMFQPRQFEFGVHWLLFD